jgi:hypothetical protein
MLNLAKVAVNWSLLYKDLNRTNTKATQSGKDLNLHSWIYPNHPYWICSARRDDHRRRSCSRTNPATSTTLPPTVPVALHNAPYANVLSHLRFLSVFKLQRSHSLGRDLGIQLQFIVEISRRKRKKRKRK